MGRTETPLTTVVTAIVTGQVDGDLDAVNRALSDRYKIVRAQRSAIMSATLRIGDKVTIQNIRPKYLSGLTGEIVADPYEKYGRAHRKSYFAVQLSKADAAAIYHKHPSGLVTGVPASCLIKA